MKIIVPMAGMGKRMRPHTLNTPKPLLKIAGKSIVERIVRELKSSTGKKIEEVHYVIGNFGNEVEEALKYVAGEIGAKGYIHYQQEALGTAHAVLCAREGLKGEVLVAFADTMFIGDFTIHDDNEAIIWTKEVENPQSYGVVSLEGRDKIVGFVEKPLEFVSNKAIIGIYYFRSGEELRAELEEMIRRKMMRGGEYQLTDALTALLKKGVKFKCSVIDEWLDCGNKEEYLMSAIKILRTLDLSKRSSEAGVEIIEPVYIGSNVKLLNSVIGPEVIIEDGVNVEGSVISKSIIGENCKIKKSRITDSVVGGNSELYGASGVLNIGDYNRYESL